MRQGKKHFVSVLEAILKTKRVYTSAKTNLTEKGEGEGGGKKEERQLR